MSAYAFSDCIRSTPARTLAALLLSAWSMARRTVRARASGKRLDLRCDG